MPKRSTKNSLISQNALKMPKAGLEPARLAAPPPQDGVSANSTTSARFKTRAEARDYIYFFSGVVGVAGVGCCPAGGWAAGGACC